MAPSDKLHPAAAAATPAGTSRYASRFQAEARRRRAIADSRAASKRDLPNILAELDRQNGHGAGQWCVADEVIKGRDSWIFRASSPQSPFPLAFKIYCSVARPKEVIRQHALLRQYRDAMASRPELTVPAPWAALPEHRALIMEWIDEPRMDQLLQRAGRRQDERVRLIAAAGRWLRHFHDHSGLALQPLDPGMLQRSVDAQLGGEHDAGFKVRDSVFRSAYGAMVRCSAEFAGTQVPYATAHGDYQAKNLLHGRRGTIGIDISGRASLPVTSDIFHFLVHAEAERPFLTHAAPGIASPEAQAFLAAYGVDEHLGNNRLMTFLYLAATIRRWAHRIRLLHQRRYRVFRIVQALRLRHMASQAVSALEPQFSGKQA